MDSLWGKGRIHFAADIPDAKATVLAQPTWRANHIGTGHMKKLRIYLDTSVVNFLFADDAPDFRRVTEEFFDHYAERYELYASEVTLLEISRDQNTSHREKLFDVLKRHAVVILPAEPRDEIERLAKKYIERKIIPAAKFEDALHVAYAVVHQMDILLSWNFKHLANIRRETLIVAASEEEGYRHPLRLISPLEAEDETDEN